MNGANKGQLGAAKSGTHCVLRAAPLKDRTGSQNREKDPRTTDSYQQLSGGYELPPGVKLEFSSFEMTYGNLAPPFPPGSPHLRQTQRFLWPRSKQGAFNRRWGAPQICTRWPPLPTEISLHPDEPGVGCTSNLGKLGRHRTSYSQYRKEPTSYDEPHHLRNERESCPGSTAAERGRHPEQTLRRRRSRSGGRRTTSTVRR